MTDKEIMREIGMVYFKYVREEVDPKDCIEYIKKLLESGHHGLQNGPIPQEVL